MALGKYKDFSNRLINAMKENKHIALRSPNGICVKTLSGFAGASEQICRRYIRGDALPDYDKITKLATHLHVSPGWLLFGEDEQSISAMNNIDETLLYYILKQSHHLFPVSQNSNDDYANFVLDLIKEVRTIDTSENNLLKIIDLAMSSISSYEKNRKKHSHAV